MPKEVLLPQSKILLDALAGRAASRPPIWLMRQAGRYLPEYRAVRASVGGFLELCYTPDLALEVTLQPLRRFGLDAAILFSDILVVADALGCPVSFVEGEGPKLRPIRSERDVRALVPARLHEHLAPVYETVRRLRSELPAGVALIGFAGAPWTLAAYMAEGEGSRDFLQARSWARREPRAFEALIRILTEATADYLLAQIEAGAEAVQLFDSWAGVLPEREHRAWCVQPTLTIARRLKACHPEVPLIAFPRGAGAKYQAFLKDGVVDALGLDTGVPLRWARHALPGVCLQGNLDPVALLGPRAALCDDAADILRTMAGVPHVFNLGHGVVPETEPEAVAALVDLVRSWPASAASSTGATET